MGDILTGGFDRGESWTQIAFVSELNSSRFEFSSRKIIYLGLRVCYAVVRNESGSPKAMV